MEFLKRKSLGHFIDGILEDVGENVFENLNPATGEKIADIAIGTKEDMNRAVASSKKAYQKEWSNYSPAEKGNVLKRIAGRLRKDKELFGKLDAIDAGRPISHTTHGDVEGAARLFEFFSSVPEHARGSTVPVSGEFLNYSLKEPYGVIGAIIPWNFPIINAATKIAPILGCGNSVVLKPAEQAPLASLLLAQIAVEEGLPKGVFNVVNGQAETGSVLVNHPDIKKVTFTGSTAVGNKILNESKGIKAPTLELGGKTASVVFADANLDEAVESTLFTAFMNQGQTCTAGTRLVIEESIKDEFLSRLEKRISDLIIGDPLDNKTQIGAVINKKQLDRILDYIEIGKEEGAKLYTGGQKLSLDGHKKGNFMTPTIFDEVKSNMRIAQEEIFGPVLSVLTFKTKEEALKLANATNYGLAAILWTNDLRKAHEMASMFESGIVWINTSHTLSPNSGYGGYKESGVGLEEGLEAVSQYMRHKTVWINHGEYKSPFQN